MTKKNPIPPKPTRPIKATRPLFTEGVAPNTAVSKNQDTAVSKNQDTVVSENEGDFPKRSSRLG